MRTNCDQAHNNEPRRQSQPPSTSANHRKVGSHDQRDARSETEQFLRRDRDEDRSVLEFLSTPNYTFRNERMAKLYGIDGVSGDGVSARRIWRIRNAGGVTDAGQRVGDHLEPDADFAGETRQMGDGAVARHSASAAAERAGT